MNSIGNDLRLTLWGSSHGPFVGCVLEGIAGGLTIDEERLAEEMSLRRPKHGIGTPRREDDEVIFASGIKDGVTNGDPISIMIANKDIKSGDYESLRFRPRPGHADFTALIRNPNHDNRGGGMFSGRLTAPLVAAGALCRFSLEDEGVAVAAFSRSIADVKDDKDRDSDSAKNSRRFPTRACTRELDEVMSASISSAAAAGDSVGGVVECIVDGLPIGVGEPWFDSLDGELAKAMFSIPAMRAFEIGEGISLSGMTGSAGNDPFTVDCGGIRTDGNRHGGVLGGRSTGMPVVFRCFFKPTPSISQTQMTVDLLEMKEVELKIEGRHDPCIVPRAVAVVEAMACFTILDSLRRGGFIGN